MEYLLIVSVLVFILLLIIKWKDIKALIPEKIRAKLPWLQGGFGILLIAVSIVNSVGDIRHMLAGEKGVGVVSISMPTLPVDSKDLGIDKLDCHLVMINTGGSLLPSEWDIQQWKRPCESGFVGLNIGNEIKVELKNFSLNRHSLSYRYFIESTENYRSSETSRSRDTLAELKMLDSSSMPPEFSLRLLAMPETSENTRFYFFLSQANDPLAASAIDITQSDEHSHLSGLYFNRIKTPMSSMNAQLPQGLQWLGWMEGQFITLLVGGIFISALFPWRLGNTVLLAVVVGIGITIALDRWAVGYAAKVAAASDKPALTRYLAIQQLRSSFFWQPSAAKAIQQANKSGFSKQMMELLNKK